MLLDKKCVLVACQANMQKLVVCPNVPDVSLENLRIQNPERHHVMNVQLDSTLPMKEVSNATIVLPACT